MKEREGESLCSVKDKEGGSLCTVKGRGREFCNCEMECLYCEGKDIT